MRNWTIAIIEVVRPEGTIHALAANRKEAFDHLRANPGWLQPHERVIGAHIWWYNPTEGGTEKSTIHSEQVGANDIMARRVGSIVRVAASRFICEICIRFFEQFLPWVRLVNPKPTVERALRPLPPPVPPPGGSRRRGGQGPFQGKVDRHSPLRSVVRPGYLCPSRECSYRGTRISPRGSEVSRGRLGEGGLRE